MNDAESFGYPAPRICCDGVSPASPLGVLLGRAIPSVVYRSRDSDAPRTPKQWKRAVSGTALRWWGERTASNSTVCPAQAVDVVLDLFGDLRTKSRVWRIVDSSGASLLSPFFLLDNCCSRQSVTSVFLIEGAVDEPDGTIIGEAHISNRERYPALLDSVARVAAHLLATASRNNRNPHGDRRKIRTTAPNRSNAAFVSARFRAFVRELTHIAQETLFNEYWSVGVVNASPAQLMSSQKIKPDLWLSRFNRQSYFADPFPRFDRPGALLCERFDYRSDRGTLWSLTFTRDGIKNEEPLGMAFPSRHFSYPYPFVEDGAIFLLPEMAAAGELVLFEFLAENRVRTLCTIEKGSRIADPTLFRYDGRYWVAYCDQAFGSCNNLCLLYADHLEGPWTPHPKNPVKIDVRSSRPGGIPFHVDGRLFRPAQDCSVTYGGAVVLNEILTCTPDDYAETETAVLTPDRNGPFPDGLHTLSIGVDQIFVDGKKLFFDPVRVWKRIRSYARRHWFAGFWQDSNAHIDVGSPST